MPIPADILSQLADVLAHIYSDHAGARTMATTAGLSVERIDFDAKPRGYWVNILQEAENQGLTQTLLDRAGAQYADNPPLAAVRQAYTAWALPPLPKPEDPQYSRLSEFWDKEIIPAGDSAFATIVYQNQYAQKFGISVVGSNDEEGKANITSYVEAANVCLETMLNDAPETLIADPIDTSETITDPEELAMLATIEEIALDVQNNKPSPLGLSIFVEVANRSLLCVG